MTTLGIINLLPEFSILLFNEPNEIITIFFGWLKYERVIWLEKEKIKCFNCLKLIPREAKFCPYCYTHIKKVNNIGLGLYIYEGE